MRVSKRERTILNRQFVHHIAKGGVSHRVVSSEVTTNQTMVTHHELCALERKKLIEFEEDKALGSLFGVKCWKCVLTAAGRALLEEREVVTL